jgi:hypothetical protein
MESEIYYCVHYSQSLITTLSYTLSSYAFKINFNIILSSKPRSSKQSPHFSVSSHRNPLYQCRRTYGTRVRVPLWEDFRDTRHSLLSQLFISFVRPASVYCEEYMYIFTYMTA